MSDTVRWTLLFVCAFNVGFLVALYERVVKLMIPSVWTRLLLVSNIGYLSLLALSVHARLGHPMTYRTPLIALFITLQLVGEIGLYRWYGTSAGGEHMRRMMGGRE